MEIQHDSPCQQEQQPQQQPQQQPRSREEELWQFLIDYWKELRRYDALLALLTAWGIFSKPDDNFQRRPPYRLFIITMQVLLSIGMALMLNCMLNNIPQKYQILITLVFVTIPVEVLNLLWFRVIYSVGDFKSKMTGSRNKFARLWYCLRQLIATSIGICFAFVLFLFAVILFTLGINLYGLTCSHHDAMFLIGKIILFQFLLNPMIMGLPYWRDQGKILSLLAQMGPLIGYILHIYKYGIHPPPSAFLPPRHVPSEISSTQSPMTTPSVDLRTLDEQSGSLSGPGPEELLEQGKAYEVSTSSTPMELSC